MIENLMNTNSNKPQNQTGSQVITQIASQIASQSASQPNSRADTRNSTTSNRGETPSRVSHKNFVHTVKEFAVLFRLPILAGILCGTSYIPFPPWALFFCLSPLFIFWLDTRSPKSAFLGGWITQFILNLIGFHWIAYTAIEFGHFPWWGGALALAGFAAVAHLYFPVAGWLGRKLAVRFQITSIKVQLFLFAFSVTLLNQIFPLIFPWHFGYPWLWAGLPGAQFADVIGFEGLNVATIVINALLAWAFMEWRSKRAINRAIQLASAAALLFAMLNFAGLGREDAWKATDSQLNILAVQGNIGNFDKLMAEKGQGFREPIVQKYIELSRKGLSSYPESQMMIWPETAYPDVLDPEFQNGQNALALRSFVQSARVPLLTGAYSHDRTTKSTYNGFFFLDQDGNLPVPPYRKSILLVFGETFPFSEYIPYMEKLFPGLGSFSRGRGPTLMEAGSVRLGPQICYEGLYPWFTASLAKQGAQVLTNVTNDSWFGNEFEPYQHLYMTLARAIEFRRPLIRSTNTGITTVVLASGEVLQRSPQNEEWAGMYQVQYQSNPEHTFYEKIVGLWGWVLAFGLVLLVIFGRGRTQST